MIRVSKLYTLLLLFIFSACSGPFIFGPERHGLNKVIKSEHTKPDGENLLTLKDSIVLIDYNSTTEQRTSIKDQNSIPSLVPDPKQDHTPRLKKIRELDHEIEAKIERITHQRKGQVVLLENEDEDNESSGVAIVGVVLLLVIIGGILLSILLFYLIIAAINQAFEDTADEFGCYVATMSYGDYNHPKVKTLRAFRDQFLAQRRWGQKFIQWYYKHSPGFTRFYANNKFVHNYLRVFLNAFVFVIKPFYKYKNGN